MIRAAFIVLSVCAAGLAQTPATPRKPAITALCPTPDGLSLVVGSAAGVVIRKIGDAGDRSVAVELDHVHAAAFSPDGKLLALAGGAPAREGVVELWSAAADKRLARIVGHADVITDVAWIDAERFATAGADRMVRLWRVGSEKATAELAGHSGSVLCLALSPDGKLLCSGSADQTIRVWDVGSGKPLRSLNNHLGAVYALAYRPGVEPARPAYLASTGADNTVRIWQPSIGRMVRIIRRPSAGHALAWERDGSRLIAGSADGTATWIDAESDEVLGQRKASAFRITGLAVVGGKVLFSDSGGSVGETAK